MNWIGKLGGGVLGFMAGGPLGALVGTALGHQFDRGAAGVADGLLDWAGPAVTPRDRERLFFETTFQALGHLAKADGRVSEQEIAATRAVMRDMGLGAEAVARAIDCFNAGKARDFPIRQRIAALRRACRGHPATLQTFLDVQVGFLRRKARPSHSERAALRGMAAAIGVGEADLARLDAVLRGEYGRRPASRAPMNLPAAYRTLGLGPDATDGQIRVAYRRLMNRHHPDKQAARGISGEALERAKERTHEIRRAWELLREERDIR